MEMAKMMQMVSAVNAKNAKTFWTVERLAAVEKIRTAKQIGREAVFAAFGDERKAEYFYRLQFGGEFFEVAVVKAMEF